MRLASEWALKNFPDGNYRLRCPLGPIPEYIKKTAPKEKWIGASRPYRPEVDICRWEKDRVIIIEAKIFKIMDGLSKLPIYKALVGETPELKEHWDKPVEMWLIVCWTAPWLEVAAEKLGIKLIVYKPDWIAKYVEERHKYWTKEYREKRIRERYGLR